MKVYRPILDTDGKTILRTDIVANLHEVQYSGKDMGERSVTATYISPIALKDGNVLFAIGDYIELQMADLNGGNIAERFYLYTLPTVKKTARSGSVGDAFEFNLTFYPAQYELTTTLMRDMMMQSSAEDLNSQNTQYTGYDEFSIFGGARKLMEYIKAVLNTRFGEDVWGYEIADAVNEDKNQTLEQVQFDFSKNTVWDALVKLTEEAGVNTDFYVVDKMIYVGFKRPYIKGVDDNNIVTDTPFLFAYGKTSHLPISYQQGNLYSITKSIGTQSPITRLYAYGNERNLNRFYCADVVLNGRYVNKLMLPSFSNDGKTDYIDSPKGIAKYGIRESSNTFDEIYPSLRYMTYADIRSVKYVIKIEGSGKDGSDSSESYDMATVRCYSVSYNEQGIAQLTPAYPPQPLAVFVHATGKTIKCVLFPTLEQQKVADLNNVPTNSNGSYIVGACFCVHNSNFACASHTSHNTTRMQWFTDLGDTTNLSDDIKKEIELHQINYMDDWWVTDVYEMQSENGNLLFDRQTFFPREGYSAFCYSRVGVDYKLAKAQDKMLLNEVVAVEPITIADTDASREGITIGQKEFVVYLRDIGFRIDQSAHTGQYQWLNGTAQVNFLDGRMAGLTFDIRGDGFGVVCAYNDDGTINDAWYDDGVNASIAEQAFNNGAIWRLILNRAEDSSSTNYFLPNKSLNPQTGDHIVLLGIFMPDLYIRAAENRLLREAQKYLNDNDEGDISYNVELDKVRMAQIPAFGLQMREGAVMRLVDEDLQIVTDNEEVFLANYTKPILASMNLPRELNAVEEHITDTLVTLSGASDVEQSVRLEIEDISTLVDTNPIILQVINRSGIRICYTESRFVTQVDVNKYLFYFKNPLIRGTQQMFKVGYLTKNESATTSPIYLPIEQLFTFKAGKHYEIAIEVTESYADRVIRNLQQPIALVNQLEGNQQYYFPIITSKIETTTLTANASTSLVRLICSFDLPESFNDRQDYYLVAGFEAFGEQILVEAYLYSIKESTTTESGEYAKFVDLTIDSLNITITDDGGSGKQNKEITATIKPKQKATTWQTMNNLIAENKIIGDKNTKTQEELAVVARRHYNELKSLKENIFDPDGTIADVFLQTMMLQVGADSMNYSLDNTRIFNGKMSNIEFDNTSVRLGADMLRHYVYTEGSQMGTWTIAPMGSAVTLVANSVYYIALKCQRDGSAGEWVVDNNQHKVDELEGYYYFNYGIINIGNGVTRDFTETRGNAYMYGDNVIAGKIITMDKQSWFDLTNNSFNLGGKLKYENGVLTISGGTTAEDNRVPGGMNLYSGGDLQEIAITNDNVNFNFTTIGLGIIDAAKNYIVSCVSYLPTYWELNDMSCIVVDTGDKYGPYVSFQHTSIGGDEEGLYKLNVQHIERAFNWGEPLSTNYNGRRIWVLLGVKASQINSVLDGNISGNFADVLIGETITIKGIMLQEGEKATGYQPYIKHLTDSFEQAAKDSSTDIEGGLIATSLIKMRDPNTRQTTAGLSGLLEDNVLLWGGGTYTEAQAAANGGDDIQTLIKKDGTGNIGIFKINEDEVVVKLGNDKIRINTTDGIEILQNDQQKIVVTNNSILNWKPVDLIKYNNTFYAYYRNENASNQNSYGNNKSVVATFNISIDMYVTFECSDLYAELGPIRYTNQNGTQYLTNRQAHIGLFVDDSSKMLVDFSKQVTSSVGSGITKDINKTYYLSAGTHTIYGEAYYIYENSTDFTNGNKLYAYIGGKNVTISGKQSDSVQPKTIIGIDGLLSVKNTEQYFMVKNEADRQRIFTKGLSTTKGTPDSGELYVSSSFIEAFKDLCSKLDAAFADVRYVGKNSEVYNNLSTSLTNITNSISITDIIASS